MTDLGQTIAPKSDQLNADDMISGPMTVTVTKVSACPGSAEQPIAIYFDGDNGKPYKPCKSMRRVLVQVWGKDGSAYIGRRMTLYRDANVMFGGVAVGGVRISHMSNIEAPVTMALTASRSSRKPYTVQPLAESAKAQKKAETLDERVAAFTEAINKAPTVAKLDSLWTSSKAQEVRGQLEANLDSRIDALTATYDKRKVELSA